MTLVAQGSIFPLLNYLISTPGEIFFSPQDSVFLTIDNWIEPIEGFVQSGVKQVFKAKGETSQMAKYSFVLDLENKVWSFRLSGETDLAGLICENNGVDLTLQIGGYEGGLRLYGCRKTMLKYPQKF